MSNYQTGDLIFVDKRTFVLSGAIRKIAKIKYSHVGVIVVINELPYIVEAIGRGVTLSPIESVTKKYDCEVHRPNRIVDEKEYINKALSLCGVTNYDYIGLLWHQFVWNLFGIWIGSNNEYKADNSFYCYEFASYMMNDVEWWKVKPKDFYNKYLKYKV